MGKSTIPRNRFPDAEHERQAALRQMDKENKEELQDLQYCKLMVTYLRTLPQRRRRALVDKLVKALYIHT